MKSDARKELNLVDISTYGHAMELFEARLRDRNLAQGTIRNYTAELKPFLAWIVKYREAKP